jgi:hypothetical protein
MKAKAQEQEQEQAQRWRQRQAAHGTRRRRRRCGAELLAMACGWWRFASRAAKRAQSTGHLGCFYNSQCAACACAIGDWRLATRVTRVLNPPPRRAQKRQFGQLKRTRCAALLLYTPLWLWLGLAQMDSPPPWPLAWPLPGCSSDMLSKCKSPTQHPGPTACHGGRAIAFWTCCIIDTH